MKKIFIIIQLLACVSFSYSQKVIPSQISREDLLEGMDCFGQTLDKGLLIDAVSSAFFLSRQSFQVADKKTGELYGLNNHDEFGTEITLGVKLKDGFLLSDKAVRPWEYNSKFDGYREEYKPVPYLSEYTEQGDKTDYDSLTCSLQESKKPLDVYCFNSNVFNGKGLECDVTEGTRKGWFVWACTDKDADLNKTAKLSFVCCEKELDVKVGSKECVSPPKDKNILGGIYIVPSITGIGIVKFLLCGVITEKDAKWYVSFPFVGMRENEASQKESSVEQNTSKDALTPIADDVYMKKGNEKQNKKGKK